MIVLELVRGGTATVLELRGEDVVVLSTLSSPPGSPLEATLSGEKFRIKVRGCRKVDADDAGRTFRIDGRFVSLTRVQREMLERG